MKKYLWIGTILLNAGLMAQKMTPVDEGSSVKFTIKNFGVSVRGNFKGISGEIFL